MTNASNNQTADGLAGRLDGTEQTVLKLGGSGSIQARIVNSTYTHIFGPVRDRVARAKFAEFYQDLDSERQYNFIPTDYTQSRYIDRCWFTNVIENYWEARQDAYVSEFIRTVVPELAKINRLYFTRHGPRLFSVYDKRGHFETRDNRS